MVRKQLIKPIWIVLLSILVITFCIIIISLEQTDSTQQIEEVPCEDSQGNKIIGLTCIQEIKIQNTLRFGDSIYLALILAILMLVISFIILIQEMEG